MDSSDVMGPNNGNLQTVSAHYNNRAAQQKQIDACHSKSIIGHSFKKKKRVPYYRFRVTCINLFLLCGVAIKRYYWSGSGSETSHRGTCRIGAGLPLSGRRCVH